MRAFLLCLGLAAASPALADLGVNLYGVSYHFDRERAREIGVDNEFNPGLGLRYRFLHGERWSLIADVGAYHDSGRNTAVVAGAGALYHLSTRWRLGGALVVQNSDTYNEGKAAVGPVPLLAYETRPLTVNLAYVPKVSDINEVATVGVWLTWWLRR